MVQTLQRRRSTGTILSLLSVLLIASTSHAFVPIGPEIQVNDVTNGPQKDASVAVTPLGDFVVVWTNADPGNNSIVARRFQSTGSPQGFQFAMTTTTLPIGSAAVATNTVGDFVITWSSALSPSQTAIFGRRYNSIGQPLGSEFGISSLTYVSGRSAVASDPAGDFMVSWSGTLSPQTSAIFGRRYASTGQPQGGEFLVSSLTHIGGTLAITRTTAGEFVVVWDTIDNSTGRSSIVGRRYASTGDATGPEFHGFDQLTSVSNLRPSVASSNDGFIVTWSGTLVTSESAVFGQRFNSLGAPIGGQFEGWTGTLAITGGPRVAASPQGDFVITWETENADGTGSSILGQRFNSLGAPTGGDFQVSTLTTGTQAAPAIASDGSGNFVTVWTSEGAGCPPGDCQANGVHLSGVDPDTSSSSIHAQIYGDLPVPVVPASLQVARVDGGAALEWDAVEAAASGYHVHRSMAGADRERLTTQPLSGSSHYRFVDATPPAGGADYWVQEIARTGTTRWYGPVKLAPVGTRPAIATLAPITPNPAHGSATVRMTLAEIRPVTVRVYDSLGRAVATLFEGVLSPGEHRFVWDGASSQGTRPAVGLYVVRVVAGTEHFSRKVMLGR